MHKLKDKNLEKLCDSFYKLTFGEVHFFVLLLKVLMDKLFQTDSKYLHKEIKHIRNNV